MEQRVSRLEATVEYIHQDLSRIKQNIRALGAQITAMGERSDAKFAAVSERLAKIPTTG